MLLAQIKFFELTFFNSDVIENIIAAKPNYVEIFLNGLKRIIEAEKNKDFTEQV